MRSEHLFTRSPRGVTAAARWRPPPAAIAATLLVSAGLWTLVLATPQVSLALPATYHAVGEEAVRPLSRAAGLPGEYPVTFSAAPLPPKAIWWVDINGSMLTSFVPSIFVGYLPNGSYPFFVGAAVAAPCVTIGAIPDSGSLNVSGAPANETIYFFENGPYSYAITFEESGLPSGTNWTVTLNGTGQTSNATSLFFHGCGGWYAFVIGAVSGYISNVTSGRVTVAGNDVTVSVAFLPATVTPQGTGSSGLSIPYAIVLGVVVGAVLGSLAMWVRLRGWKEPDKALVPPPPVPPSPPLGPS